MDLNLFKTQKLKSYFGQVQYKSTVYLKSNSAFLSKSTSQWKNCLIGYFEIDVNMPLELIRQELAHKYKDIGVIKVLEHLFDYYDIVFDCHDSYKNALQNDCLTVYQYKIILNLWMEYVFDDPSFGKQEVSVKFVHVPFIYWNEEGICTICSAIGKPIVFEEKNLVPG